MYKWSCGIAAPRKRFPCALAWERTSLKDELLARRLQEEEEVPRPSELSERSSLPNQHTQRLF